MIISTNTLIANLKDILEELREAQDYHHQKARTETDEKMRHFYHDREVGISMGSSKLEALLEKVGIDVSTPVTLDGEVV